MKGKKVLTYCTGHKIVTSTQCIEKPNNGTNGTYISFIVSIYLLINLLSSTYNSHIS